MTFNYKRPPNCEDVLQDEKEPPHYTISMSSDAYPLASVPNNAASVPDDTASNPDSAASVSDSATSQPAPDRTSNANIGYNFGQSFRMLVTLILYVVLVLLGHKLIVTSDPAWDDGMVAKPIAWMVPIIFFLFVFNLFCLKEDRNAVLEAAAATQQDLKRLFVFCFN